MHYISCPFAYNVSNYLDDYFFQINKEMLMYIYIYIFIYNLYMHDFPKRSLHVLGS